MHTADWEFPAGFAAAELARHRTADALAAWGFDHFLADAILVVSELVTNAVMHAESPAAVRLRCDAATLWIGVSDDRPGVLAIREWHRDDKGGLGLRLVEALAQEWHVEPNDHGKTVWCQLVSAVDADAMDPDEFDRVEAADGAPAAGPGAAPGEAGPSHRPPGGSARRPRVG